MGVELVDFLGSAPPVRADTTLEKTGEFRPFPKNNKLGGSSLFSVVDTARGTWFFVTYNDPVTGAGGTARVWTLELDGPTLRGAPISLAGGAPSTIVGALDGERGVFFLVYGQAGARRMAAMAASSNGPVLIADWNLQPRMTSDSGAPGMEPAGLTFSNGKGYLAAESLATKETIVVQFDVARFVAGQDPFDWRYRVRQCVALAHFNVPTAVGKSRYQPTLTLPCRAIASNPDLQGVAVVDLGTFTPASTAGFVERFYPISGNYERAESYFDQVADRMAMRRISPSQLVVFDIRHRRWMRPVVFGQNNMEQSALDVGTGRIYGNGDDPGAGSNQEYIFVPEVRPTPPQNGLTMKHVTPSPGSTQVPKGQLAVDSARHLVYVADVDSLAGTFPPVGLFFHVYSDNRPVVEGRAFDPDNEIANWSAESQGYGARVSYVGGSGATYSNLTNTNYPFGGVLAQGSRHVTFARTLRARLSDGESSAEAIVSHPEGASAAELAAAGQPWPHQSAGCNDFGSKPTSARDEAGGVEVTCDVDYPRTTSAAVYKADTQDPRNAPVQRAATETVISVHATKGVTTTVTSEGTLDIPGIVSIGRMRATATTHAAGRKGTATSTYTREMRDVSIAGQPFCSSDCDPEDVAAEINGRFASLSSSGTQVTATVPRPDPTLLGSPGGVQAIVQRDLWDHEEDIAIHDGAEDRFELPAFVLAFYQDRKFPQHEIYSLAAVQAVSRLPQSLADDLDEFAAPDPAVPTSSFTPDLGSGPVTLDDLDVPVGPAGSSLSAPLRTTGIGSRGPRSLRFSERLAWSVASPLRSPAMLAILAFLAVPVYLSSRRRVLQLHRPAEAGDVDAG